MAYSEALIATQNKKSESTDDEIKSLELIHSEGEKMNVIIRSF
jgi:hypothetical protein